MWNCLQSQLHKASPIIGNFSDSFPPCNKRRTIFVECGRNRTGCCWLPCSLLFDFRTRLLYWFLAQVHNLPTHTHINTHTDAGLHTHRHRNTPCGWCSSDGMCICICIRIPWLPKGAACANWTRYTSICYIHNGILAKLSYTHTHTFMYNN